MDYLRRELAPISPQAWNEIDSFAREILSTQLSGRKFLDVDGPRGVDYAAAPLGRLSVPKGQKEGKLAYGVHQVLPLVEARRSFVMKTWELDDIERGAKGIELESLAEACREIAEFEEKAVYHGFPAASILGLEKAAGTPLPLKLEPDAFLAALSEAQTLFVRDGISGPANLIAAPEVWKFLSRITSGGTLKSLAEKMLGGRVIYSAAASGALLAAARGGDAELVLGQDLAIGYHSHGTAEVNLFITESFTFRVITPEAVRLFKIG